MAPRTLFSLLAVALVAGCVAAPVPAPKAAAVLQMPENCFPADLVEGRLAAGFSERVEAIGVTDIQTIVQLYTSADGETWTIVHVGRNGVSCVALSGRAWHPVQHEPAGEGA